MSVSGSPLPSSTVSLNRASTDPSSIPNYTNMAAPGGISSLRQSLFFRSTRRGRPATLRTTISSLNPNR